MDISSVRPVSVPQQLLSPPSQPDLPVQQQVTLKVLKQAIEFEGQLALQLIPQPAGSSRPSLQSVSSVSLLGQHIDTRA